MAIAWDDTDDPSEPGSDPIGVSLIIEGVQVEWFGVVSRAELAKELREIAEAIELGDYTDTLAELGVTE